MGDVFIYGQDGNLVYEGVLLGQPCTVRTRELFDPLTNRISITVGIHPVRTAAAVPGPRSLSDLPRTSHTVEQRGIQIGNFGGILRSEHHMRVRGPLSQEVWTKRMLQLGLETGYGLFYSELARWDFHERRHWDLK